MADIEIEIDGKTLKATTDTMVIQVADEAGIYIPRFCYHKHLSVAANCRMCLVEVEKSGKPLPACATPCMPGMKVFTKSPKALAAQKAVMEFLLINHPLDCPICDQGGECELQDLTMGFGGPKSFFNEGKRSVKDKDIGPLIETEMTRCIQCTRCVRFGAEVAGMRELGATSRGEDMEIGTYVEHAMKSEVSGNVIDICPVGALTSKPFRFSARAWELEQRPTVSQHDCLGSNLYAHVRNGKVMRLVPRENMTINETWISDRDRFSYEGLYHTDRTTKPLIKKNGTWQEVTWQTAIEFTVSRVQQIIKIHGAEEIGALASPSSSLEEFYLLQKLMRGLGSSNVDHRLRQTDFSDDGSLPAYPSLGMTLAELAQKEAIFLIGSNIQKEQPSAGLRVRKAFLKGAKIMALNCYDYDFHFDLSEKQIVSPDEIVAALAGILKALSLNATVMMDDAVTAAIADVSVNEQHAAIAKQLQASQNAVVILGNMAMNHPEAALIRTLAAAIAKAAGAQYGLLTEGANAAGAWFAGAIPHRGVANASVLKPGLNAQSMLTKRLQAYFLLNVEPDLDCANPVVATEALATAEFVVSLSLFRNSVIDQHADVILPIAAFVEKSGTLVNSADEWQTFRGIALPHEESRPAWKVLRVLGNIFELDGFDYASSEEIHHELKLMAAKLAPIRAVSHPMTASQLKAPSTQSLYRIGAIPIYSGDSLVRRAKALQAAQPILEGIVASVRIHPATAAKLQLQEGEMVTVKQKQGQIRLPVRLDDKSSERGVYIAGGIIETSGLSELYGALELQK
ncbi:MAG: NADH-quinone oxidoreductase subunit NuoG [Gammaproteobacteria bacterium]|nr:NADH-quinone oxidoreductase subunit NuoG [Gammaproteobacteria bacterium]